MTPYLDDTIQTPSLDTFALLEKGDPAPDWLYEGVCKAWGIKPSASMLTLITVSENATFLLSLRGDPFGVVRVSQPGYVGGPRAIASELEWVNSLHDIEEVNLVTAIPTVRDTYVVTILDEAGVEWACICSEFVEGVVLEDLDDPSSYYRTLGRWSALFHNQSRTWELPENFKRFNWGLSDMIGPNPRWGRWEETDLGEEEFNLLKHAENEAIKVMEKAPRTTETWGVIHADLRPSNVIADEEGNLTVIDFDDAGFSWYLYDYAAALSFVEHEPYAPAMAKAWVEGYRQINDLSDHDIEVASALSMLRRLQMLGWTVNHPEDALPDGLFRAQAPGTVACARRYLENPTWLLN